MDEPSTLPQDPRESSDDSFETCNSFELNAIEKLDADVGGRTSDDSKSSRLRLTCFECNRPESHVLAAQRRWFFSYLLGLTFGGILLFGPYQCQCCGAKRLMCSDLLNLRTWFHHRSLLKRRTSKRRF